jgi:hypothetical protein
MDVQLYAQLVQGIHDVQCCNMSLQHMTMLVFAVPAAEVLADTCQIALAALLF